jgi:hypothetical protein
MKPAPPIKTIEALKGCEKVGTFVFVCESRSTFAYDCERRLCNGHGFRCRAVELFDFEPTATAAKIVGVFDREWSRG